MKNFIYPMLLISATILVHFSCNKYPNGPEISLQTKENRLCNHWKLVSAKLNQQDKTDSLTTGEIKNFSIEIKKDGAYTFAYVKRVVEIISGSIRETKTYETEKGSWKFAADKKTILFNHPRYNNETAQHPILRLTKNELWLCEYVLNPKRGVMDRIEYHWER